MLSQRISWIDIARGIGIILVIHGHSLSADSYRHLIYAFHMPLFFFISGLVFNYVKNDNVGRVIQKSIKAILVPYFGFAILTYVLWIVNNNITYLNPPLVVQHMTGILYGNSSSIFFNIVLWFLPCLFITKVGFAAFTRYVRKTSLLIIALIVVSVLGFGVSLMFPDLMLPFGVETALSAVVFFGAGSVITTKFPAVLDSLIDSRRVRFFIGSLLLCVILGSVHFALYGKQIDMRMNNLNNYILFYGASLSGIFAVIAMSKIIQKNYALEVIGKYSLVLFALHPLTLFYFNNIASSLISSEGVSAIRDVYLSPAFTIFSIGSILALLYVWKRSRKAIAPVRV